MVFTTLWILLTALLIPVPIGTDRRQRFVPWVTYTLIAINVVVYIFTNAYSASHPYPNLNMTWGLVPAAPRFTSLVTCLFMHVSLAHLFWNMVFLWLFGPHVEEALGRVTFIALYFGGGVASGLLHMAIVLLVTPMGQIVTEPLVGASGAISAILAPYAVRFHRSKIHLIWFPALLVKSSWAHLELPAVAGLGIWLLSTVYNAAHSALFPSSGGTAYWAHIGGFVFGLIAAELTNLAQEGHQEYLLEDARAAAARPEELPGVAAQKYRSFLNRDPNNVAVHAEFARTLLFESDNVSENTRREASEEMLTAIRLCHQQGRLDEAVHLCSDVRAWQLPLALSSREHLRLGSAAQDQGDNETAIFLLRSLVQERPNSPEDEIARYKLIQLLLKHQPADAKALIVSFLGRYPQSQWTPLVRDMQV
jgi:membrane associated rhomboid family serine protease